MDKITIIQLLNKIANGEEVPSKIKYDDMIFEYDGGYYSSKNNIILEEYCNLTTSLNDEVEILEEEKKIPEKLTDILRVDDLIPPINENMYKIWTQTIKNQNKINEIISYLDYLKSKGE